MDLYEWIQDIFGMTHEALAPDQQPGAAHEAPAPAPEEVPQEALWGELEQPLLSEEERFAGLKNRRLAHYVDFREEVNHTLLEFEITTQMGVEVKLESALRQQGYLARHIHANRDIIRGILFYPRGRPQSESTLLQYLDEMDADFETSRPYELLTKAQDKYDLPLYKRGDPFFDSD